MAVEKQVDNTEQPYNDGLNDKDYEIGVESGQDLDVAAGFLAKLDPSVKELPISDKEARRCLWKIDLAILPILTFSVIIAAVDKVVISNAAIYGMKADTHLKENEYSWVGSIFYFGYLIFEYPAGYILQRLPVARVFAVTAFCWGALMMCTAAAQNFGGLATCRFLMGMAEAFIFPLCALVTVMWWKNDEQPIRAAIYLSQGSSIFTGVISYGIGHAHTSIASWRLLFLVLGGFSVLWAGVIWIFLPDSPTTCWYMSDRQKYICLQRIRGNNTGLEEKNHVKWNQVRECMEDPRTWLLFVFSIAQNIPNGGIITFSAIIVSGLGYSTLNTTLLGIPTGIIATLWAWMMAWPAGRLKNARCLIIAGANCVTIVCSVLMWKLPRSNQHGLLAAYYVFYTYWGPYCMAQTLYMSNTSGHSKKVSMGAVYFVGYCVGNIIGPQVFRDNDAPKYSHGYSGLLACLCVAIATVLAYGYLCFRENRKRDHEGAMYEPGEAFSDKTDKEKRDFRYIY
ncbi:MFS general substrate transporter [Hortaea werneckii]|nr:MFS general substrate transporter [Hortaea werneckii]KAI7667024.1 MFS general substrate transporter [Hortaea werneckii]KAI7694475.1 MFS general substrate transporter [Hortaea werneckii]